MPYDGDMNQEITPILRACGLVDGQAELARKLGVSSPTVNQWVKGQRPVPSQYCSEIERHTMGQVVCEELNPSLKWARIPDRSWKWHPKGRPVVDATRAAKPRKTEKARA